MWGLNVERQIKRKQEIDRWTAARPNIWIGNLAEAGRLEGSKAFDRDAVSTSGRTSSGGEDNGDGTCRRSAWMSSRT